MDTQIQKLNATSVSVCSGMKLMAFSVSLDVFTILPLLTESENLPKEDAE